MWLPLLILVSSVVVIRQISKSSGEPLIKIGAPRDVMESQNEHRVGGVFETQGLPKSILGVIQHIHNGETPERWLIDRAISDAYNAGRWDVVKSLSSRFPEVPMIPMDDVSASESPELAPPITEQANDVRTSPFEGVSNEDWNRFIERLATEKDDYRSDKHVGRFHHSRHRLSQLGIDAETLTPDRQYEALVADLSDSGEKSKELIGEFMCTPITINGSEHTITMSGLYTLLKAAGPNRARSWILNDGDRSQYPKTTEMFLQTNGMF